MNRRQGPGPKAAPGTAPSGSVAVSRKCPRATVIEPTDEALQSVLHKIITRLMGLLTRRGVLVEEEGST